MSLSSSRCLTEPRHFPPSAQGGARPSNPIERGSILRRLLPIALIALATVTSAAIGQPKQDPTPLTCDNKSLQHHRWRARTILRHAYPDPARSEIEAFQAHRRCIRVKSIRLKLGELRDRLKEQAEQAAQQSAIDPPGASYLAGLRECESGGDYSTNTGNGFYGAYQFTLSTWASVGGSGSPSFLSACLRTIGLMGLTSQKARKSTTIPTT